MAGISEDSSPDGPSDEAQARAEAERFRRLVEPVWAVPQPEPPAHRERAVLRHGQPFMGRAVFDFGRREQVHEPPPAIVERVPCPLCGEPNRLRHAYCRRCSFRLPWAASVEGLPESHPRLNRIDQAIERTIASSDASRVLCRFCGRSIGAYDRRCARCRRWLLSNWNTSAFDAWQPDFDAWNFSQMRGFRPGCLSPILFVLALALWRALA